MNINRERLALILGSLRALQSAMENNDYVKRTDLEDIITDGGKYPYPHPEDIDVICEDLNRETSGLTEDDSRGLSNYEFLTYNGVTYTFRDDGFAVAFTCSGDNYGGPVTHLPHDAAELIKRTLRGNDT